MEAMKEYGILGYRYRKEILIIILWNKAASSSPSTAWGSWMSASNPILRDVHEYILVFSKGDYKREIKKVKKTTSRALSQKKILWNGLSPFGHLMLNRQKEWDILHHFQ